MSGVHFLDARAPEGMRLYAIGDVHGRADLLKKMHSMIDAELAADPPADWRIIHVGDYVDRGPDSRGVIDFLIERRNNEPRIVALAGNHDVSLLDFLDGPENWRQFASFGGQFTARSYGVEIAFSDDDEIRAGRQALRRAVPAAHRHFLRSLDLAVVFGDFYFCHAGVRPGVALDAQDPYDLIWIRSEFLDYPGLFDKVIVHGHTPVGEVEIMPNRVDIDTRAFETGRLSAIAIEGAKKRTLTAQVETCDR